MACNGTDPRNEGEAKEVVVRHQGASVRVLDYGELVSVCDLEIPEGSPRGVAVILGSEVMRIAAGRPTWLAVEDGNTRAIEFFSKAGFKTVYRMMVKANG